MPKIKYVDKEFSPTALALIKWSNAIVEDFKKQGYELTLRSLYYQLVTKLVIPNNDKEYKRLGSVINDARLAGLVDWHAIIDRTRNLRGLAHWTNPQEAVASAAASYTIDRWAKQAHHVEVWVEKDALLGVVGRAASAMDVSYFSCRGYTSQSEMWSASQRLLYYEQKGKQNVIFHLGDHDPSGVDMTRDIRGRLTLFCGHKIRVKRVALTMEQVEHYGLPPNPAKLSDSRSKRYIARYGKSSWELDALSPSVLHGLIRKAVKSVRDEKIKNEARDRERTEKHQLQSIATRWASVLKLVESTHDSY
jgi:hypothetical protein